ncbi:hypothetical protein D3C80_1415870 [compost metagenome]
MDTHAKLHLVVGQGEGGLAGGRHCAGVHGDANGAALVVDATGQHFAAGQVIARFGGGAHQFFAQHCGGNATATGGIEAVFHRHVVIDQREADLDPVTVQQLDCGLEVEHVAGVVLHQKQHARAAIDRLTALVHLIRGRGGKNLAGAGAIQHPFAHQTAVHRLVAAATAGDQRHLAHHGGVGAGDVVGFDTYLELGVGGSHPHQLFTDHGIDGIDQLLHGSLLGLPPHGWANG